jgi:hypothetical protein
VIVCSTSSDLPAHLFLLCLCFCHLVFAGLQTRPWRSCRWTLCCIHAIVCSASSDLISLPLLCLQVCGHSYGGAVPGHSAELFWLSAAHHLILLAAPPLHILCLQVCGHSYGGALAGHCVRHLRVARFPARSAAVHRCAQHQWGANSNSMGWCSQSQ